MSDRRTYASGIPCQDISRFFVSRTAFRARGPFSTLVNSVPIERSRVRLNSYRRFRPFEIRRFGKHDGKECDKRSTGKHEIRGALFETFPRSTAAIVDFQIQNAKIVARKM